MWSKIRIGEEAGFGLPTAIMAVIVFAALALLGIALTHREVGNQVRVTSRSTAFYAAEAGLAQGLENWNRPDVLGTGQSWVIDQGTFPGGTSYRVIGTMLDDGTTVQPLYAIQSVGRARNGATRSSSLLVTGFPFGSPVGGAIKAVGQVKVVGQAQVNGWDSVPAPWTTNCPSANGGLPGALMSDTSKVAHVGSATIEGDPSVEEQSDTTGWFNFGSLTYEQIAAIADLTLPGGTNISFGPAPSYNADGSCNTSDNYNWGDPLNAAQPCSRWFPIIHATGDLTVASNGAGQGILLVDGNFDMSGGFTFYGIIVAKGSVKSSGGGFRVIGGVVSGESDLKGLISGGSIVQYSECVVSRVLSRGKAARPLAMTERPWFEIR